MNPLFYDMDAESDELKLLVASYDDAYLRNESIGRRLEDAILIQPLDSLLRQVDILSPARQAMKESSLPTDGRGFRLYVDDDDVLFILRFDV